MAEISDLKRKFKSVVSSFQKIVECPVCLETVKTPFKVCARGHAACVKCITKLQKCPLCQESYILENIVCVKSMLEALPCFCRYSDNGCEEIMEPGDDHEMFCGYRPIVCRFYPCSEKIPLVQFLDHKKQHCNWYFQSGSSTGTVTWYLKGSSKEYHGYAPISLFGNLFWFLLINDVKKKQLRIYFQATPIGKLEHKYYARVTIKKGEFVYTYTLKASVLSSCSTKFDWKQEETSEEIKRSCEKYCMKILQCELSNLINDEGKLLQEYFIFKD